MVYVLTKYDADWGSLEDYLVAFTAGATLPTAAQWALLPFKRSYSALVTTPQSGTSSTGGAAASGSASTPSTPSDGG
jgi:hypothetical protein